MNRHLSLVAMASVLGASTALAIAPMAVLAGPPTEIIASPANNSATPCIIFWDTANWSINLNGGTSGKYQVTVYYGDGQHDSFQVGVNQIPYPWSYSYVCPQTLPVTYRNDWYASRGGGGTGHELTHTTAYP